MKTKLKLHLLILTLVSLPGFAHAQGTAIGYQGRLNDAGTPATGLYDLTFNVFDVEAAGAALAGPIALGAVPVTNGVFSVSLDFGPDLFTGPARWLEITVRTNGVGVPSLLTPRTSLLPTPYALFAGQAGSVANGTVTADQLNSGGVPPAPGQFLSYAGGNFLWTDPGVAAGNIWSLNGLDAYYNAGNVGIGTDNPQNRLHVYDPAVSVSQRIETGGGINAWAQTEYANANGLWKVGTSRGFNGDQLYFARHGAARIAFGLQPNGDALLQGKLTVRPPALPFGVGQYGIEHTDGDVRLSTYLDGSGGWLGTRSNHPLNFYVNDGVPSMTIDTDGHVTMSGGSPGSVIVGTPNSESGLSIIRGGNRADVRFEGTTLKLVVGPVGGPPASTRGIAIDTAGNVGIGTTSPSRTLEVNGDFVARDVDVRNLFARDVSVRLLTIRGGADLAEPFAMSHSGVEPGSVVVIDEDHPGKLRRSTQAYDKKAAGIVSGANGIRPGISMVQEDKLEAGENVALSGRVYVHADAAYGAIKPGDLLTTSDTPGHAMKVTEHAQAQGAILGKAMSGLKDGKGMVLVLVTLQ